MNGAKMSENEKPFRIIEGGKDEVSDEDFRVFMTALLGEYKGGGYLPE